MNFLWMEYFTAVVEAGSIRKASERLYISDQAVSEVVKKLEKELGAQLLSHTRPQRITPAGEAFYRYASQILQLKRDMMTDITENYADCRTDTVRIGVSALGQPLFLPPLLERFHQQFPAIKVEVVSQPTMKVADFSGADLYFPPIPLDDSMEHIILHPDDICVLVSQTLLEKTYGSCWEAACREMESGQLSAFQKLPFIDLQTASTLDFSRHGIGDRADFHPVPLIVTDSFETNFSLCVGGYGVIAAMRSEISGLLASHPQDADRLRIFPLNNPPGSTDLAISYRKGKRLSSLERAFIQVTQAFFERT